MSDGPVRLRKATVEDVEALARLARASFDAAFGHLYDPADLAAFFASHRSPERIRADLADPACRICLADDGGTLAGYCLIRLGASFAERPDPRPERPVLLSQLYCAPGKTGRGTGKQLLEWAISEAKDWGADAIQLSVFSENTGAQRFYHRHGFRHVGNIDFWVGNHRDDELLYELRCS